MAGALRRNNQGGMGVAVSSILVDEGVLAEMTAEHYLCKQRLAEARAALNRIMTDEAVAEHPRYTWWRNEHAAALKAAREAK